MEWWEVLLLTVGGVALLLATGLPVAFCFILINLVGVFFLQGGTAGSFQQLILNISSSVGSFTLLPVPLFILMGEVLWHSRVAMDALGALDKLLGRLPGRLSVLTVLTGGLFSTLSGSTMANTAMLGTMLLPEMERRGYRRSMSIGPILASGGLAMMIPPSALAVILATLAKLSIAGILLAAVVPGLLMAFLYFLYIIVRCALQPSLTPGYELQRVPWSEKLAGLVTYILPLGVIVFLVTGSIIIGVATPTEAAALGCLGAFVLVAAYGRLDGPTVWVSVAESAKITVMMLAIMAGAIGFSQILAHSGATRGLLAWVLELPVPPLVLILLMQLIVFVLGTFMEQIAIMMITLPIFMPIVQALGFDPIWFAIIMLINLQMALTTPPFGLLLFVMKGVAPAGVSMRTIYLAGLPFLMCDAIAIAVVIAFPATVSWLPDLVR